MKWKVESGLLFTPTHEWLLVGTDGLVRVGIADYAQDKLGSIVFVELPELGREVGATESIAVIESVKAVVDTYAPVGGTVTGVNTALEDQPELLNEDPYHAGWIIKMKIANREDLASLMNESAYVEFLRKLEQEEAGG